MNIGLEIHQGRPASKNKLSCFDSFDQKNELRFC